MLATSGTVGAYPFSQAKVIEHAYRRATGRSAERIPYEQIQIAQDLILTLTSEWINAGFPLWTIQYLLLPITAGSRYVTLPVGTNDVFHSYWRILNPWRGAATLSTGADGSVLFAGQPNADVIIPGPNAAVAANFGGANEVDTIGVLLGGSTPLTAALQVQTAPDGQTWTTVQTLPSTTYYPQVWSYFDLAPVVTAPFVQLLLPSYTPVLDPYGNPVIGPNGQPVYGPNPAGSSMTLNQLNFGLAQGQDIELGALNQDDQFNLPDKQFQNPRPVSYWLDRKLVQPVLNVWPAPNQSAFYNGTVTALVRRYIQDPGAMANAVDVPQRWLEALIWRLAQKLYFELPQQDLGTPNFFTAQVMQARYQNIEKEAAKAEMLAWAEERIVAPIRWAPNISVYTR